MNLWHLNNIKVILTLQTPPYVDCIPLFCIDSFHIVHHNGAKSQSWWNFH